MEPTPTDVRAQLLDRRQRVQAVIADNPAAQFGELLHEIDLALERVEAGTYGLCETCGDPIEAEGLRRDPLARFCIDHLTPSQARELEQDLDLAAHVQSQLLPPRHVVDRAWEIAYQYEPRGTVSGDYLDIVRPAGDGGDPVFLLGDISGKGVAASMLMAHLHASMRALVGLGLPLQQVVERANGIFCDSTMANHYATLVCGRLAQTGEVAICNAGHCAPLLVRAGQVTPLESTGVPIGLFCVKEYPISRFRLAAGDALVLYTDGVTEARNDDDLEYGFDRLAGFVAAQATQSAPALVHACLADVAAFRGRAPRADDVTVMVIRRTA